MSNAVIVGFVSAVGVNIILGQLANLTGYKAEGANRVAFVIAGAVMAVVILAFAGLVGHIAMPALAGLLMLVGYRTIKPDDLESVWKTGAVQKTVLSTSFVLTMVIPLQYAVLVGAGLSVILHVVRQSNRITIKRWRLDAEGNLIETDPPSGSPPTRWSSSSRMGACSSPPRQCPNHSSQPVMAIAATQW